MIVSKFTYTKDKCGPQLLFHIRASDESKHSSGHQTDIVSSFTRSQNKSSVVARLGVNTPFSQMGGSWRPINQTVASQIQWEV